MLALLLAVTLAGSGCPAGRDASGALAADLREAADFVEVRADRSSDAFRARVEGALAVLEASGTPVARQTLDAIRSGRVRVDELGDLTRADFRRVAKSYAVAGDPITGRWENLAKSPTLRKLEADMAGWMWDDRVYVAKSLTPVAMARALAHEVSHVLNESEEHYRGKRATLIEEYRAFLAEELAVGSMPSPAKLRAIKRGVIRDYELDGLAADDVADVPPGILAR